MNPRLPSTASLVAFETAARHGSFTGAAAELFLTVGAVSKQLRSLEETLGVPLFVRSPQGLVLTDAGSAYLESVRPVLTQLSAAATRAMTAHLQRRTLMLRVFPAIAERWLLPRFGDFIEKYPEIEVQFTTYLSSDRLASSVDASIRFGKGKWPEHDCDYLTGREVCLVASPKLLQRTGGLKRPQDVFAYTLLQHVEVPEGWSEFRRATRAKAPPGEHTIRYDYYSVLIRAAVAGMGFALIPQVLVEDELASGVLVNPLKVRFESRSGYYFVYAEAKRDDPAVMLLRQWLLDAAGSRVVA